MMVQFLELRAQAPADALLFYRMGDFYELFFDDAVRAAAALEIALTKRGEHQGEPIPMCGVPAATAEAYLARLIKAGFKVAVGEQMEDPKAAKARGSKAVVRRDITRVVTPGTLTEDSLLDPRRSNRIAALARTGSGEAAIAWAEVRRRVRDHVVAPERHSGASLFTPGMCARACGTAPYVGLNEIPADSI